MAQMGEARADRVNFYTEVLPDGVGGLDGDFALDGQGSALRTIGLAEPLFLLGLGLLAPLPLQVAGGRRSGDGDTWGLVLSPADPGPEGLNTQYAVYQRQDYAIAEFQVHTFADHGGDNDAAVFVDARLNAQYFHQDVLMDDMI